MSDLKTNLIPEPKKSSFFDKANIIGCITFFIIVIFFIIMAILDPANWKNDTKLWKFYMFMAGVGFLCSVFGGLGAAVLADSFL